jgi:hypothetical protein
MLKKRGIGLGVKDFFQNQTIEQLAMRAVHHADLVVTKMRDDAAEERERLSTQGKIIEEGVFS